MLALAMYQQHTGGSAGDNGADAGGVRQRAV